MGLYERIRDKGLERAPNTEVAHHFSIPEPADSDIIRRTKIAMGYFTDAIRTTKGNKAAAFMRMLTEDMIEESSMVPEDMLEFYMKQAASILYWTATGETIINMPMPSDFKHVIPKELRPNEHKAIDPPMESDHAFSDGQQSSIVDLYLWIHNWLHR